MHAVHATRVRGCCRSHFQAPPERSRSLSCDFQKLGLDSTATAVLYLDDGGLVSHGLGIVNCLANSIVVIVAILHVFIKNRPKAQFASTT